MTGLCECGCGERTKLSIWSSTRKGWIKGQPRRYVNGHNNRGKERSPEYRERIAAAKRGRKRPDVTGALNRNWKGEDVGYYALHIWIARHKTKTGRCVHCGTTESKRTEWANVSGDYRRDLDDYIELCTSCHRYYDNARQAAA